MTICEQFTSKYLCYELLQNTKVVMEHLHISREHVHNIHVVLTFIILYR